MARKPASLSSDLLAQKGQASPTPVDPDARATRPVAVAAVENGGKDGDRAKSEPEIIYLPEEAVSTGSGPNLRLAAGALAAVAIVGGVVLAVSFNREAPTVAPVAPQFSAAPEEPTPAPVAGGVTPEAEVGANEITGIRQEVFDRDAATAAAAPESDASAVEGPATLDVAGSAASGDAVSAAPTVDAITPEGAELVTGSVGGRAAGEASELRGPVETAGSAASQVGTGAAAPEPATPVIERAGSQTAALEPRTGAPAAGGEAQAAATGGGAYLVQLGSVRSEAAATREWAKLQARHSGLLGDRTLDLQRADLGDRGTYYRIRTGSFDTKVEASALCRELKAAGQDCLVWQRPSS